MLVCLCILAFNERAIYRSNVFRYPMPVYRNIAFICFAKTPFVLGYLKILCFQKMASCVSQKEAVTRCVGSELVIRF